MFETGNWSPGLFEQVPETLLTVSVALVTPWACR